VLACTALTGAPWLLNVNIPNRPDAASLPRRITRLGRRHASEPVIRQTSPRGETIYWIGPAGDARDAGEGTDFHAVANGFVSITPLQVDLTDHAAAQRLGRAPGRRGRMTRPSRFPLALDRVHGQPGSASRGGKPATEVLRPQRPCTRRRRTRRASRRPAGWAWTRRPCDSAWWSGCAPAAFAASRCCRPLAVSSATVSWTPRWPRRPMKTRACPSAAADHLQALGGGAHAGLLFEGRGGARTSGHLGRVLESAPDVATRRRC
jgi:hypothetical protein